MTHIRVMLLGSFQVQLNGAPVAHFRSDKVRALLAYLALEADRPHTRAGLCGLLWPDKDDDAALQNLSQTLRRLREALGEQNGAPSVLRVSRQSLQWEAAADVWVDATVFARNVAGASLSELERAVDLYRGELLPGFGLPGCDAFDEWLLLTRERFANQALTALETLTRRYLATDRYAEAAVSARRALALNPLQEASQRLLMHALAASGDRAAALTTYERYRQVLHAELGVAPDPATNALAEQIRSGSAALGDRPNMADAPAALRLPSPRLPHNNLPAQLTAFIGRTTELAELGELLHTHQARLITLGGAGGMGKTSLALEFARRNASAFAAGVCFVDLASLVTLDEVSVALLHALHLQSRDDPTVLLRQFLRDKQLLLVLDNVEHLPGIGNLLADLLQAAPDATIIVTSREYLNIRGEQRYPVRGLPYVPDAVHADAAELPAVQLCVHHIRRVQPGFRLDGAQLAGALRIARLVQGMPLGIELAAAWVELLPLETIAQQIEQSIDFLAVDRSDLPERQRSMRAVFAWSWRLLHADEQRVFRQLAIFRGGFTLDAAAAVAGATPAMVLRLVGTTLVQADHGRYSIHELLRQFAREQLDLAPDRGEVEQRHSRFYLGFVADREHAIFRADPVRASNEILHELDNIRQAWRWAATHRHMPDLERSACSLALFYRLYGVATEWEHMFLLAVTHMQQPDEVDPPSPDRRQAVSMLMALLSAAYVYQGKHSQAAAWAERAIELSVASGGGVGEVHGLLVIGQVLRRQGQSAQALDVLERTAALCERYRQGGMIAEQLFDTTYIAYNWLCSIALTNEAYADARGYVEQGLRICRRLNKAIGLTVLRSDQSDIAFAAGDYAVARRHGEEALQMARKLKYHRIEGSMLVGLGALARMRGDYTGAHECVAQALLCFQRVGDTVWEAIATTELGYLHMLLGDYTGAQAWLDQADDRLHAADQPTREVFQHRLRLAQVHVALGDHAQALLYATQAVDLAHELHDGACLSESLSALGAAYARLGQNQPAIGSFTQALDYATQQSRPALTALPHAGLAELALAYGDLAMACMHAAALRQLLLGQNVPLDAPFDAYMACYRVLAAAADPHAPAILQQARHMYAQYLSRISDPALRTSFSAATAHHGI
jgi:predicted ATPase/DNA-binding SARP family transcriptional activator